jgi:sugar/nucleoside kinase (ribokinase family)
VRGFARLRGRRAIPAGAEVVDTAGAGNCFFAGLVDGLANLDQPCGVRTI